MSGRDGLSVQATRLRAARLSAMRAEISARLLRVTAGMGSEAVDALIDQMAIVQDKYEQLRLADRW